MNTRNTRCRIVATTFAIAALHVLFPVASAWGRINVELRPYIPTVALGANVNVGIYVVSDSCSNQPMAAADIMFGWDPARLHLIGLTNAGATPLLSSTFPNDGGDVNEVVPPPDGSGP